MIFSNPDFMDRGFNKYKVLVAANFHQHDAFLNKVIVHELSVLPIWAMRELQAALTI